MTPRQAFLQWAENPTLQWREIEYLARLFQKVEEGPSDCWLWTGSSHNGYGVVYAPKRVGEKKAIRRAHRVVWMMLTRQELGDLTLDHLCGVRLCVNPAHLEPVTLEENVRRGWAAESVARRNRNREKNCCPHGHPYDEANTHIDSRGGRKCRTCIRERQARRRAEEPEVIKQHRAENRP